MHQKVETAGPVTDVLGSLGNEVSYSATVSVATCYESIRYKLETVLNIGCFHSLAPHSTPLRYHPCFMN